MYHHDVPHVVCLPKTVGSSLVRHVKSQNSYLDRINVSNARLAGLQSDLGIDDTMWNLCSSTFYIGYVLGQLPGNLWLAKANPRLFLPICMLAWSAATICMPAMVK